MKQLENFVKELTSIMTVSGYEKRRVKEAAELCDNFAEHGFDEVYVTKSGSAVFVIKAKGESKYRLAFDAHIDTVGFAVSEICEDGYIRVTNLGGIDVNILPASEVLVHGKKTVRGVFSSIPPHLSRSDKLPEIGQLYVDTGFSAKKDVEKIIDVGTPVTMYPYFSSLLNNRVSAAGLDDKICIAAIMQAARLLKDKELQNTDVYCYLSSGEERGGNGSHHIFNEIKPDACIVLDVNFAREKGSKQGEYGLLGKGAMISLSSVTNGSLTQMCRNCAVRRGIPFQPVVEMTGTGTNADVLARTGHGIATAVVSVPLRYMHSSVECVSLDDVNYTAQLLAAAAEEFDKKPAGIPVYYKGGADLGL